jgi:catalase
VLSDEGAEELVWQAEAINWIRDAFGHLKVIGMTAAAQPLLDKAAVEEDEGIIDLAGSGVAAFIDAAKQGRIWDREPKLRD